MSAIEPLCHLMKIKLSKLSKEEYLLLEGVIFIGICQELKEFFREQHNDYFRLMKFTVPMENTMLQNNIARLITCDILSTEEYNLNGIARYTDTPADIIQEVIDGRNIRPSATFLWRIIELHQSVRRDLYAEIMKKIINQFLVVA